MTWRQQWALALAGFLITLILVLSAAWAIRQPKGERYLLPTRVPTLDPAYKTGGVIFIDEMVFSMQ